MISKEEYIEFAENGFNIVPLIKTIEKDLDSPIKVFSRIKNKKNTFSVSYTHLTLPTTLNV